MRAVFADFQADAARIGVLLNSATVGREHSLIVVASVHAFEH